MDDKYKGDSEVYSDRVRAGKRTYFFDVKVTRTQDYYLTVTESKRKTQGDGFEYEKHKIFLYKEDFEKFSEALDKAVNFVKKELFGGKIPAPDTPRDKDDY